MFYGKEKEYTIARPEIVKDAYNHETASFVPVGTALIHLVIQDRSMVKVNQLQAYKGTLVGYTRDMRIQQGWKIGTRFIVKSTMPHRNMNILYLEVFEDGR